MRRGVVLPEGAVVAGLPAFDGLGGGVVAGVGRELVCDGPAADAGAVGFKLEAAVEFAGDGTVGRRGIGGEKFGGQRGGFRRPVGVVIAAGKSGGPYLGPALCAGEQVIGAELVEAAEADAEFKRDDFGLEQTGAGLGEEMADQGCGTATGELRFRFFLARKVTDRWILRLETDAGSRAGPTAKSRRACRLSGFRRRSGCVPAEPYPPLKQRDIERRHGSPSSKRPTLPPISNFDRTDHSSFVRTTTPHELLSARSLGGIPGATPWVQIQKNLHRLHDAKVKACFRIQSAYKCGIHSGHSQQPCNHNHTNSFCVASATG